MKCSRITSAMSDFLLHIVLDKVVQKHKSTLNIKQRVHQTLAYFSAKLRNF